MKRTLMYAALIIAAGLWMNSKLNSKIQLEQTTAEAKVPRTLHLFAMSDYFPEKVLRDFEAKHNCKIRYDNFSNNEELLAKLQAGAKGYDIIVPSDYTVRALVGSGLVQPIDKSKIPNFKNLAKYFTEVPYDPGSKYSVAFTWGTTGIVYNKNKIKKPVDSWDIFLEKEYAGRVSLLDDEREVLGAMLRKLGYSPNSIKMSELKEAQKLLLKLKPNIRLFASDPKQHLLSGDIWLAHVYSGDAQQIIKTNPEFVFVTPKEGSIVWVDTLAIPKDAPNKELAHAFIDNILDPQVGMFLTEELRYSSPNSGVESLIKNDALKPSAIKKIQVGKLEFLKDLGADTEKWDQLWTEAKTK